MMGNMNKLLCAIGVTILLLLTAGCNTQRFIELEGLVDQYERAELPVKPSQDATGEKCTDAFPCDEAVATPSVNLYKFDTRKEADAAGEALGDRGYVSNWIVIEFVDPDLTEEQKTWFKQGPDDTNTW